MKFLTALELLILQERGCLSLFDSPLKWFPHWNISKGVTLEAMASHMAGLGRDRTRTRFTWAPNQGFTGTNAGYCGPGLDCLLDEAIDLILGSEPDFPVYAQPSCTCLYSNMLTVDSNDGFILLGQVIEAAHGTSHIFTDGRQGKVIRGDYPGRHFRSVVS
jgi:CubicO group peptidase (beta-lactamase class C family)